MTENWEKHAVRETIQLKPFYNVYVIRHFIND